MKNKLRNSRSYFWKQKLTLIMRTFIFLICTTVFSFSTEKSFSQYPQDLFTNAPKVKLKKGVIKVSTLLKQSFSNADVEFELTSDNKIFIRKKALPDKPKENSSQLQYQISGSVVDENGEPLSGANIIEKGTNNGVQADFDGNFSINVNNENAILVVSYIGFSTKEVSVNESTNLAIVLEESTSGLDEVIVVGYGTQKKSDLTGSVISVSEEDIQSRPVASFQDAIQGRASGVVTIL